MLNTSRRSVQSARTVLDHGAPELVAAVDRGEVTVSDAARIVKADPDDQRKALDRVKAGEARTLRHARMLEERDAEASEVHDWQDNTILYASGWPEFTESLTELADLLITDPPYMTDLADGNADVHEFAADWVPECLRLIKRSGRAYICTGAYPEELTAYGSVLLAEVEMLGWIYSGVLVWTYRNTLGPTPTHDYSLNWQAIHYLRGPEAPPLNGDAMVERMAVQDINAPDGRVGDRYHAWQKPDQLAERLILHSTNPGDLVIDPFSGTGTFLLAAAKLGRRAIGCDPSAEMRAIAKKRGVHLA